LSVGLKVVWRVVKTAAKMEGWKAAQKAETTVVPRAAMRV